MSKFLNLRQSIAVAGIGALALVTPSTAGAVELNEVGQASTVQSAEVATNAGIMSDAVKMKMSNFPRRAEVRDDDQYLVYTLKDGREIGLPDPNQPVPLVDAGFQPDRRGFWIELTPLEQQIVANGGSAGIAGTICVTTGGAACAVATAAAAVIATYVSNRGVCPNKQRLVTYHGWNGRIQRAECR